MSIEDKHPPAERVLTVEQIRAILPPNTLGGMEIAKDIHDKIYGKDNQCSE